MHATVKIQEALEVIQAKKPNFTPQIALILGSGLGVVADEIQDATVIPYQEIPHFPASTVKGHAGQLVLGHLMEKPVLAMQGRLHYYEGHHISTLAFPIRIMKKLGVEKLLITTATGGVNQDLQAGDLMLIKDHINFTFTNPLIGPNLKEFGPRFPDTSQTYTPALQTLAKQVAQDQGITLKQGNYFFVTGPSYETPAEVEMAKRLGADVVGMSTVPEALIATHTGIQILGITYIANMAAGISPIPLTHADVLETMKLVKDDFIKLIKGILEKI